MKNQFVLGAHLGLSREEVEALTVAEWNVASEAVVDVLKQRAGVR